MTFMSASMVGMVIGSSACSEEAVQSAGRDVGSAVSWAVPGPSQVVQQ